MPSVSPTLLSTPSRLAELRATGLLDSPPEAAFDRLTRLASRVIGAPVAIVSLVDDRRQFFKSVIGLAEPWASARQTPLSHSFCQHVVATASALVIRDAREDSLVTDNLAIADLGVVAYAGMPLTTSTGETLGSFCVIDTVPRRWTEDELEVLQALAQAAMREVELRAVVTELQRVNEYKNQILGFASHELRTPLNGIMGALQIIELDLAPGSDRTMVDIALQSSRRLLRLINDLLNAEQLESGAIAMHRSAQAADALIASSLDTVRSTAADRGVSLHGIPSGLYTDADADRIVQVLVNIVGNALKFTARGTSITVGATPDGGMVRFSVRDHGRGVPDAQKERIFERFAQVEAADKHEKGGAGLGLAICRAIVVAHGGRIWVDDAPGGGSMFVFTTPAVPD